MQDHHIKIVDTRATDHNTIFSDNLQDVYLEPSPNHYAYQQMIPSS